jgi:hypothetical protein
MSLVVCSNQDADGQGVRQINSVNKAWAFRNTLSSTYKIPANAQVALQSCKVNIDGRVVISESNSKFYQYFGEKLDLDGVTSPQSEETTSYPVYTDLLKNTQEGILEVSLDDFANVIQDAIRESTYHPNVKGQPTCEVLRNASSLDFLGYKITYNQKTDKTSGIPADNTFEQWYRKDGQYSDEGGLGIFTYGGGIFLRTTDSPEDVCAGICPALPMHNLTGEFEVGIGGTSGRANASGVEWHVGLSRYVNNVDEHGFYVPTYVDYSTAPQPNFDEDVFMDFGVGRDTEGNLIAYQYSWSDVYNGLIFEEIEYWNNANSYYNGSGAPVALDTTFTDVRMKVEGEIVKAEIEVSGSWRTITEFDAGSDKDTAFKPVNQACWCLHPVLAIGQKVGATDCTLEIKEFHDVDIVGYNPKVPYKGGWFETMELEKSTRLCEEVESRDVLQTLGGDYTQVGVNGSDGLVYDNVLILQESEIYDATPGANCREVLGFSGAIIDTPNTIVDLNQKTYQSNTVPSLTNSLSMFVRLNNFGQNTTNARIGNRSKILAHLTDLETTIGRQTYEPKNLIWLDLDNPAELNVNEFDISFCYVNEQFSTVLTGQSIVALYFRSKPKM